MDQRPATKHDIDEMGRSIIKQFELTVRPIQEEIISHRYALYGSDGRNGLSGDMRDIKTTVKNLRWFMGILGTLAGILGASLTWIWKYLKKIPNIIE